MKKNCCEKCGKVLSFFERKQSVNNDRMSIHYDNLCSNCAQQLNQAIALIDDMFNHMITALKVRYHLTDMFAADLDLLIYLGAEAVYTFAPDFYKENSVLKETLLKRNAPHVKPEDDLCLIIDRVIDYGFSVNKKNAQIVDFTGYFHRNALYVEQVGLNSKEDIPKSYYNMFITCKGLVASHMETAEGLSIAIGDDELINYEVTEDNTLIMNSMFYPEDEERNVVLYPINEAQCKAITDAIDQTNVLTHRRRENQRRNLITLVTREMMRDLKKIRPDENFAVIPLDCLLIFLVKNLMSDPAGRRVDLYAQDGPAMDILFESFYENLVAFGRTSREDLADYIRNNTLLSEGFRVEFQGVKEKAWAFFTTRGYIICFLKSRKVVYVYEDTFPNDIYYPCFDCIYKGCRYLQLAENTGEIGTDFRNPDGLIFYSEDIDVIGKMNRFFNLNNIFYVMDRYVEAEGRVYDDRASVLEVKRISDKLFSDFSFLPFCQYDEWAAICEKMREDDFLLCQLIDQKIGGKRCNPAAPTSYTIRIMRGFNKGAKELNSTLRLGDISVAKAILWGYFNESLIDTLSREWIRVAGDIVRPGDSLEEAFSKYFSMADIESDKSYYMGLFIYYLMGKGVLSDDNFLENYERCIPVYRNFNKLVDDDVPDLGFDKDEEIAEVEGAEAQNEIEAEKEAVAETIVESHDSENATAVASRDAVDAVAETKDEAAIESTENTEDIEDITNAAMETDAETEAPEEETAEVNAEVQKAEKAEETEEEISENNIEKEIAEADSGNEAAAPEAEEVETAVDAGAVTSEESAPEPEQISFLSFAKEENKGE